MTINRSILPYVLIIIALILIIGGAFYFTRNPAPQQSSTQNTTQAEAAKATETPVEATPAVPESPEPTPTPTTPTDPTTPAETPTVEQLTKPYAISRGEDDYQSKCFYQIINYRTDFNLSEAEMHAKYDSIKQYYPSMCAALNIIFKNPKDAALRGV